MRTDKNDLLDEVASYYSDKLALHGETPNGVDWNGEQSQALRFEQLCKVVAGSNTFSICDLGCGYGALVDHLRMNKFSFSYLGVDISAEMVKAASQRYKGSGNVKFMKASEPGSTMDYCVASGIFNVRLGRSNAEWQMYLENTLDVMDRSGRLGFSFNCLTAYSDENMKRADLFYADPCFLFDLCKRRYSRHVSLLHDYGLYEFTIVVRKP
jgi:SAM-dependent methyltransferase